MSSLTTPGEGILDIAGAGEDDNVVEMMETPLPPLRSVFDCPNLESCIVRGKNGWRCLWCGLWSIINTCTCYQGSYILVEEKEMCH